MRLPRPLFAAIALGGAVGGAVAVGLSGCVDPGPTTSPSPSASATPLYSSDAAALSAAQAAYAKYVEVSNQVAHDGWKDLSPLKEVATGDALKADEKSGKENRAKGLHVVGDLLGTVKSVQRIASTDISVYACLDVSQTQVIDEQGQDVTSDKRADVYPFELKLEHSGPSLLIVRSKVWSGDSFC